jgi:hypothetical protein
MDRTVLRQFDFPGDGNVEKESAMPVDELCGTELTGTVEILFHALETERNLDSSLKGIYGKLTVLLQGIVSVPYKVILGTPEYRLNPFVFIRKNGSVSCNNGTDDGFGHLRFKRMLRSQSTVKIFVNAGERKISDAEYVLGYNVARFGISPCGFKQLFGIRSRRENLNLCGDRNGIHGSSPPGGRKKKQTRIYGLFLLLSALHAV